MMTWHNRLTQARESAVLKKTAFARLVGVSPPTVTDWENGDTKMIEGANLVRVCAVLGVTAEWLLNGVGTMPEQPELASLPAAPTPSATYLQRLDQDEADLLEMYRLMEEKGRNAIKHAAKAMPKTSLPDAHFLRKN